MVLSGWPGNGPPLVIAAPMLRFVAFYFDIPHAEPMIPRRAAMSVDTIATLAAAAVIVGFLWSLHRDVADIRERLARLEGAVGVLSGNVQTLLGAIIDCNHGRTAS